LSDGADVATRIVGRDGVDVVGGGRFVYANVARLIAHFQPQVELRTACGCHRPGVAAVFSKPLAIGSQGPAGFGLNEERNRPGGSILSSACRNDQVSGLGIDAPCWAEMIRAVGLVRSTPTQRSGRSPLMGGLLPQARTGAARPREPMMPSSSTLTRRLLRWSVSR